MSSNWEINNPHIDSNRSIHFNQTGVNRFSYLNKNMPNIFPPNNFNNFHRNTLYLQTNNANQNFCNPFQNFPVQNNSSNFIQNNNTGLNADSFNTNINLNLNCLNLKSNSFSNESIRPDFQDYQLSNKSSSILNAILPDISVPPPINILNNIQQISIDLSKPPPYFTNQQCSTLRQNFSNNNIEKNSSQFTPNFNNPSIAPLSNCRQPLIASSSNFVNDFTNALKSKLDLKTRRQPYLEEYHIKTKQWKKLQRSFSIITNCPNFDNPNNLEIERTTNRECQCHLLEITNDAFSHSVIKEKLKSQIDSLKNELPEEILQKIAFNFKKAQKKKDRLKRLKAKKILEKEERLKRCAEMEIKFDEWQKTIAADEKAIKEKFELQKAVDRTMNEVLVKISDLNKQLKLLTQLKKLRKLRCERRKKNDMSLEEVNIATKNFESRTGLLEKFINQQMSVYKDEEHTLKVMLDIEAEVDAETKLRKKKKVPTATLR